MVWAIFVLQIITLFFVLGLVGAVANKEPKKTGHTFLDEDESDFLETPVPKGQRPKKQAVKKTTTLKKARKSQKRAANGRFA